jgi:cytidylate kinase
MPYYLAHTNLRQLIGSLRTAGETPTGVLSQETLATWPFVTISRQAGAGGVTFSRHLAEHLNNRFPNPPEHPWQSFDHELVERIAADHHLSTDLIESLEKSSHTWISEFFSGLSLSDQNPSEMHVFRRVVQTVRALARAGHVIMVELGGMLITRDMPWGIHVRIVAPFEFRVKNLARLEKISEKEAREAVTLRDRDRDAFLAKFWPAQHPLRPEMFHLTLNSSLMSEQEMAQAVMPLIHETATMGFCVPAAVGGHA